MSDRAERARKRRQARTLDNAERPNPLREEGEDSDGSPPITEHKNELLRESVMRGQTLLEMLDDDLEAAWSAWLDEEAKGPAREDLKSKAIRGRVRGLAQAITTVRSPFSRQNMGARSTDWAKAIKATEDESLARVRVRRKAGSMRGGT